MSDTATESQDVRVLLQLVPPPDAEVEKDYYFTFGSGQAFPNGYVKIRGTFASARQAMFDRFGPKWSMQYGSAEEAGVDRWNLTEVV
jgi:hypothetical protein